MDVLSTALPALGDAFALILQPQQIMFLVLGVLLARRGTLIFRHIYFGENT